MFKKWFKKEKTVQHQASCEELKNKIKNDLEMHRQAEKDFIEHMDSLPLERFVQEALSDANEDPWNSVNIMFSVENVAFREARKYNVYRGIWTGSVAMISKVVDEIEKDFDLLKTSNPFEYKVSLKED